MVRKFTKGAVVTALTISLAAPAAADGGDLVTGLIGGMIGAAIVNGAQNQGAQNRQPAQQPSRTTRKAPSMSAEERARNVEIQTALNHFGYPVGSPDGVLGKRSRAAIAEYQATLAFPPTGTLTETERQILVTAYQRVLIGGNEMAEIVADSPMGLRGMLVAQRNMLLGGGTAVASAGRYGGLPATIAEAVDEIARNSGVEGEQLVQRAGFIQLADLNRDGRSDYLLDTAVTGSGFWCQGEECAVRVFVTTPEGFRRNDFQMADPTPVAFACEGAVCRIAPAATMAAAPEAATPEAAPAAPDGSTTLVAGSAPAAAPALPTFGAAIVAPVPTYAAHCEGIGKTTAARGGALQTVALVDDPAQALGEQFCQVSAAAREDGATLMQQVQGYTPDQIAAQCKAFATALSDRLPLLETSARDDALGEIQKWLASAGMPQDQLVGTARICLSVGYATDDAAMALGSAFVLTGTGNMIYAELVGHHLAAGLGVARDPERAAPWFDGAAQAVRAGQKPVFLSGQADRMALVQKAAAAVIGQASAPPLLPLAPATVPAAASSP